MLSRSWKLFLNDIIEAADKVLRFTENMDFSAFAKDERTYDAVLRNLEIIGEAAKSIPDAIKKKNPEIDWRGMAGLRDILAHAYFGLDDVTLWDIVQNKVPTLLAQVRRIFEEQV